MIAAILRVYYVLALKQGQAAAIWSCREDVIAILVGQATMIRPIFTKRFWNMTGKGSQSSNSYPSKPGQNSNGHELSDHSRRGRMGFRKPKDPYDVSVLETKNESEERIVASDEHGHTYSDLKTFPIKENDNSTAVSRESRTHQQISVSRSVDVESVGDNGYGPEEKPNYGHNSRIHSKWNAF